MAGDWIKFEHWTPDKPEVFRMAELLNIDPDAVTGKLVRIWIWADQQTITGNADSVTRALLDRLTQHHGFTDAMLKCGWLEETESGFHFVNFDRHNGETAKTRALNAKRAGKSRSRRHERHADSVTSALPKEEKRREDIDIPNGISKPLPKTTQSRFTKPTVPEIAAYCQERKNQVDPQRFFDHYESKGWKVGKVPMKNWRSAVHTWEKNNFDSRPSKQSTTDRQFEGYVPNTAPTATDDEVPF